MKGYELVPEAYRQKFRSCEKLNGQTHVEFARVKEQLFDRWCNSMRVDQDHDKLRQLVLLEEFKRCVPRDVKTFIDDQKADSLEQADYSLTHKVSFVDKQAARPFTFKSNFNQSSKQKFDSNSNSTKQNSRSLSNSGNKGFSSNVDKTLTCNYCKKPGHLISECFKLKRRQSPQRDLNRVVLHTQFMRTTHLSLTDLLTHLMSMSSLILLWRFFNHSIWWFCVTFK